MKLFIAVLLSFFAYQTHADECLETVTTQLEKKLLKVGDCQSYYAATGEGYCDEYRSQFPLFYSVISLKVINNNCQGVVVYQGTVTQKEVETKTIVNCTRELRNLEQAAQNCAFERQKYLDLLEL